MEANSHILKVLEAHNLIIWISVITVFFSHRDICWYILIYFEDNSQSTYIKSFLKCLPKSSVFDYLSNYNGGKRERTEEIEDQLSKRRRGDVEIHERQKPRIWLSLF